MNEVSTKVRLVFPDNLRKEFEFFVPLSLDALPTLLWKETDDHVAGIFEREGDTRDYILLERTTRQQASARGIKCFRGSE
jgi:hypothetical protein